MTKGVPSSPRVCIRCNKPYQPTSGSQRYCVACRPIMMKVYASEWSRRNLGRRKWITKRAITKDSERTRKLKRFESYRWRESNTTKVLEHYSNDSPACACCGELERDFLVIDHLNGGGNKHRQQLFGHGQGGWRFYSWLIHQDFPSGFQVLCFNCNMSKAKHGKCIHKGRPLAPVPPSDVKSMNRSPDLQPRGDEASFVRWNPREKTEGQAFKESSKAGESPG